MNLRISCNKKMERPWTLSRVNGKWEQHAHFFTKKQAVKCRTMIDKREAPRNKEYRFAMKRILTKEEYEKLNRKSRYYNQNAKHRKQREVYKYR